MKKTILFFALATLFVACTTSAPEVAAPAADSLAVDSAKPAVVDTCAVDTCHNERAGVTVPATVTTNTKAPSKVEAAD